MEKLLECLSHEEWYIPGSKQTTLRTAYHFVCLSKLDELELFMRAQGCKLVDPHQTHDSRHQAFGIVGIPFRIFFKISFEHK